MIYLKRDITGFSLVEVIIAIAILGFSLLAIIPLLATTLSVNTETSLASRAQMLGAELISEIQAWPEQQITNTYSNCLDQGTGATCEWDTQQYKGSIITRTFRIDTLENDPNISRPSGYMITVYVTSSYKGSTLRRIFTAPWRRQ